MNRIKATLVATAMVVGAVSAGDALARGGFRGHGHGHGHFGVFIGAPLFWPWYPPPAYYYPPAVAVPTSPPAYIERGEDESAPPREAYWYHCSKPEGYYPYIKECPGGWQRVAPKPPPS